MSTSYELTRCPVCDSLDNEEVADRDAIRAEVEEVWAFHQARLRPEIPPEFLIDRVAFSQHPPLRLCQCRGCSHLYRNPWERRQALEAAYRDSDQDDAVLQALFDTQRGAYRAQVRRLSAVTGRAGRGLEVGSYVGGFLAAARDAGWVFEGVDVNERAAGFAKAKGFVVTPGELGEVTPGAGLDAVAIWNTFEQLYDARAAVMAARRLLREGGILAIRIPNGGFYIDWRRRTGRIATMVLAHNNLLSFPYRQGFTSRSATTLLERCRFEVVRVFGDTLVPVADRWTTVRGAAEERIVKRVQRLVQRGWKAPWVEVYARAV